jgi:ribonuclease HII
MASLPLCGIDEAGRGPIAGPLMMAGVVLREPIAGLDDSKKLTQKKREALYDTIMASARWHLVRFDAGTIDADGISACLAAGLRELMAELGACDYLFDGNSTFGVAGLQTMVKADASVPEVGAASVLAKVARDREMEAMALRYPAYGFERHKGYGTEAHVEAIRQHGYCPIHRRSFRLRALEPTLFQL